MQGIVIQLVFLFAPVAVLLWGMSLLPGIFLGFLFLTVGPILIEHIKCAYAGVE